MKSLMKCTEPSHSVACDWPNELPEEEKQLSTPNLKLGEYHYA
jgi:hypothetical protein